LIMRFSLMAARHRCPAEVHAQGQCTVDFRRCQSQPRRRAGKVRAGVECALAAARRGGGAPQTLFGEVFLPTREFLEIGEAREMLTAIEAGPYS
jgi:hypothetical protein